MRALASRCYAHSHYLALLKQRYSNPNANARRASRLFQLMIVNREAHCDQCATNSNQKLRHRNWINLCIYGAASVSWHASQPGQSTSVYQATRFRDVTIDRTWIVTSLHYSIIRRWFASCVARTRTWVGAVTQDIPYTTRKKRYLQRSYVFIEHFMAFNINATRKLHKIAHHHNTWLNSPHQPSLSWKKNRTAILFTVARARFKCVFFIVNQACHIARRRSESVMKTVNRIIAHVTNYVICAYPARKWLNFASIFTDHSSAREIILTLHCHQAATNLDTFCMCLLFLHWYSDYPHGTECFL